MLDFILDLAAYRMEYFSLHLQKTGRIYKNEYQCQINYFLETYAYFEWMTWSASLSMKSMFLKLSKQRSYQRARSLDMVLSTSKQL